MVDKRQHIMIVNPVTLGRTSTNCESHLSHHYSFESKPC